jgi:hypothetical protein
MPCPPHQETVFGTGSKRTGAIKKQSKWIGALLGYCVHRCIPFFGNKKPRTGRGWMVG